MNDDAAEAMVRAGGGILLVLLGVCLMASAPVVLARRFFRCVSGCVRCKL